MSKYGAVATRVDGIRFDSLGEAERYAELKLNQLGGVIAGLRVHVKYPLVVNGQDIGAYFADFVYVENGREVIEDFKGMKKGAAWAVFQIKRKLVLALYGVEILVTTREG